MFFQRRFTFARHASTRGRRGRSPGCCGWRGDVDVKGHGQGHPVCTWIGLSEAEYLGRPRRWTASRVRYCTGGGHPGHPWHAWNPWRPLWLSLTSRSKLPLNPPTFDASSADPFPFSCISCLRVPQARFMILHVGHTLEMQTIWRAPRCS